VGNGSTDLIDLLARAFLGPEEDAVISERAFARFGQVVRARNGRARLVPMRDRTHDLEAMAGAVGPSTRLVYVANPNNPTGTWNRRREVDALVRALPEGVVLVLDEAYHEYADDPDYPNGLDYVRAGAPVVVLRTFSKAMGLAGGRVGYLPASPDLVREINKARLPYNLNFFSELAARATIDEWGSLRQTVDRLVAAREDLLDRLGRVPGIRPYPSRANFFLIEFLEADPKAVFEALFRRGVLVRDVTSYPRLARCLRVSVGCESENATFLGALEEALSDAAEGRR